MKFKKLNARGFSHDLLVVAFVVIFAIAGVAYLVASHADTCGPNSVSGTSCTYATDVTPTQPLAGYCDIINVPASGQYGQVITPTVIFHNTGTTSFTTFGTGTITTDRTGSRGGPLPTVVVAPGQSISASSGLSYTVDYSTGPNQSVSFSFNNTGSPAFSCTDHTTLPANPNPITKVTCNINGVPSNPTLGQVLSPSSTLVNAGNQQIAPSYTVSLKTFSSNNRTVSSTSQNSQLGSPLQPGQSSNIKLASYTVQKSGKAIRGTYSVTGTNTSFNCVANFKLP
jgi:hypothetical protein